MRTNGSLILFAMSRKAVFILSLLVREFCLSDAVCWRLANFAQ
jgi:hypothetical protein